MNVWISFSQPSEFKVWLFFPIHQHPIYTRIQRSELHHLHGVVATLTIYGLAWTQENTCCWISRASSKEKISSKKKINFIPCGCYLEQVTWNLPLPVPAHSLGAAHRYKKRKFWGSGPWHQKCFLIHCTHPLPTSTACSLKLTCPHTPVILPASRQATWPENFPWHG